MLDHFFDRMLVEYILSEHLSNRTPERRAGNGQDEYFVSLPLTKWALLIIGHHQRSPTGPVCHWLREIVIVFGQNYVSFYVLLLEVHLGQFRSEKAALVNMLP